MKAFLCVLCPFLLNFSRHAASYVNKVTYLLCLSSVSCRQVPIDSKKIQVTTNSNNSRNAARAHGIKIFITRTHGSLHTETVRQTKQPHKKITDTAESPRKVKKSSKEQQIQRTVGVLQEHSFFFFKNTPVTTYRNNRTGEATPQEK